MDHPSNEVPGKMRAGLGWVYFVCGAAGLIIIAVALNLWGAAEIRTETAEAFLLTFFGAVWLVVANKLFAWLGVSFRDDVAERRNVAALIALCGALMAVALIYAGGSIGEGPSALNNFFSAGIGTVVLFLLWILLELGANVSRSIAEERDMASGLRMFGFMLAIGAILGRAVAGDWHSAAATVHDLLRDGWPVLVLWVIAVVVERIVRPSRRCPLPPWRSRGLFPALAYLALAGAWLWHLGAWEGMPK